ncbi:IPT/TIG domain-containing protein [Geothrix fermentans]|uniref:IPT/TIG domain-containing protein n=1 Tax=Geothrix fermentans TaxID=44676 RepID=UPI0004297AB5|nr:IPT/TIG domain-containing protein [Geothrix fermentans]
MHAFPTRCLPFVALAAFLACGGGGGGSTPPAPVGPAISAVNPGHGSPGTAVVLTGTNLLGASAVSFNGSPAFSYQVVSASEIDAVVPGGATTGPVRVTTTAGSATSPAFTVDPFQVPTLTSFAPASLQAGATVTLTGTHFVGTTRVQFNGLDAASFTVLSDTSLQATAPSGLTAGTLAVTTPGGIATSATTYTVATSAQVLLNTGFEQTSPIIWRGDVGTIQGASGTQPEVVPHGGTQFSWLGGYGSTQSDQITQDLYVPATATSATATFYMKIVTAEPASGGARDSVLIEALDTSGASLGTLLTLTNLDASDYKARSVDLRPYRGRVVRLSFKSVEDAQRATSFLLDDVLANIQAPAGDLAPLITSFTPSSGVAGETTLQISGGNFFGVTGVAIGGAIVTPTLTDGTSLAAAVPASASVGSAPIQITNAMGTGTSAQPFSVIYGVPVVTGVNPTQGPVGTPVVITGSYLGYPATTLTLNGLGITPATLSPSRITFTVPAGATSGNLVISTPGGSATRPFTVNTAGTTLDLHVENVQVTQSTQDLNGSVPLVAGKDAFIRVFVLANQANAATPSVKITLMDQNAVAVPGYPKIVAPARSNVPTSLDESSLASSWNLAVPGTDLTMGLNGVYLVSAEVDPAGGIPEADKSNNTLVRSYSGIAVPVFRTTIFPVALANGTGNITEANKGAWVARLAKMFPVASTEVAVGATFTSSVTLKTDGTGWDTLLNELTAKHLADGASGRYYFGAMNVPYSSGVAGVGWAPYASSPFHYRTAIGWDKTGYQDGGNFPEVFAHETGHNMGRPHSPCGTAASPDPAYPYPGGSIGVWGYDTTTGQLKSPATDKDIMGYCSPNWVSDYVYKKILDFRSGPTGLIKVTDEDAPLPQDQSTARECLIVRGIVHADGQVELLPSFRTRSLPTSAPEPGDYTLEGVDQKNLTVFSTPVALMDLGCWPKGRERHFVMALPLEAAVLDAVTGLRMLRAGRPVASLRGSAAEAAPPEVQRLQNGKVQLTWDVSVHPAVLVRDADSGEVLAILSGGRQAFTARARRFELAFGDGGGGRTLRLKAPE